VRPDVFRSVVLMSAPFSGPPSLAVAGSGGGAATEGRAADDLHEALAALDQPRKHYQRYYGTREANDNMLLCPQGVHDFLRAYYHHKSADWAENRPFALAARTAEEFAKMPTYYVMPATLGMAETVAEEMPSPAEIEACSWLRDEELAVYASEFGRTGFQGGLQWYRASGSTTYVPEQQLFAGRTIDVPSMFLGGASDWGVYQRPGGLEEMRDGACSDMRGVHLVEGAGHWVQQEQPEAVSRLLVEFLGTGD